MRLVPLILCLMLAVLSHASSLDAADALTEVVPTSIDIRPSCSAELALPMGDRAVPAFLAPEPVTCHVSVFVFSDTASYPLREWTKEVEITVADSNGVDTGSRFKTVRRAEHESTRMGKMYQHSAEAPSKPPNCR